MLTYEQHVHFSDHGWVLLEDVLDGRQCSEYIDALDRFARTRLPLDPSAALHITPELSYVDHLVLYDDLFLDWLRLPGILEANRQLVGARVQLAHSHAHIKRPHPERATRAEELGDYVAKKELWHRELRPKWGTFAHDHDPRLVNCSYINNITYLTAVRPGDGGTAVLDGSHKLEGDYESLKGVCEVREMNANAGSVLLFTESLIHSGMPILSENTRYNMYYGFVPPWYRPAPGFEVPAKLAGAIADEELRELLGPGFWHGAEGAEIPSAYPA